MTGRTSVWGVRLLVGAAFLAVAQSSPAQVSPVQIDPAGLDPVGDAPHAADIGKVQSSVALSGALRRVTTGVWLNRSDLNAGERVDVYYDWDPSGGDPTYFGGDHRLVLFGHAPSGDLFQMQGWIGGQWVANAVGNPGVSVFPDGRVYFRVDFQPGGSTPESPRGIGLRVSSTPAVPNAFIDYAPNLALDDMMVSLEPHGLPDPLEGCTYSGGCVGPASGPGNFGPGPNTPGAGSSPGGGPAAGGGSSGGRPSTACTRARRRAGAAGRKLSRARARLRSSRASYLSQRRKVRQLKRRYSRLKRIAAARC
jgi:hypothetical protein